MATTKVRTAVATGATSWTAMTLTASAADVTSDALDLRTGYGAIVQIKITNGATGPTVPAQCIVQTSADNSTYFAFTAPLVAGTTNSASYTWAVEIPIGVMYLKLVAGSNTAQDVTITADISNVTAAA